VDGAFVLEKPQTNMKMWLSCCSSLEGETAQDDHEAHRTLLSKAASGAHAAIVDSGGGALSGSALERSVLPDLEEPKPNVLPLGLRRSRTDESNSSLIFRSEQGDGSIEVLPRRYVSSEMASVARSVRPPRGSAVHVEDVLEQSGIPSPLKRRIPKRSSHISIIDSERGADSDIPEGHNVVYSSWFALLSKSLGSDIGSPSWLASSSTQIEGA